MPEVIINTDEPIDEPQMNNAKLDRIEVLLERIETNLEIIAINQRRMDDTLTLILSHVEPKPDGGYILGTGHEDDVVLNPDGSPMTHEQAIEILHHE